MVQATEADTIHWATTRATAVATEEEEEEVMVKAIAAEAATVEQATVEQAMVEQAMVEEAMVEAMAEVATVMAVILNLLTVVRISLTSAAKKKRVCPKSTLLPFVRSYY